MSKFSLRDYCRAKLPCSYAVKDESAKETVVLRGCPVKTTPEALASHAKEYGIKAVKFPKDIVTEAHTGKLAAGACAGEVAEELVKLWLTPAEEAEAAKLPQAGSQPNKTQAAPANGSRVTVPAK